MIKAAISQGEESHQVELEGSKEDALAGKSIGDEVAGGEIGLTGYTLEITGGSDQDGIPMRSDLEGSGRKGLLVSGGQGFNPERDGERRRKTVRGNTVGPDVVQVNLVVTEEGGEPLPELIGES